MTENDGNRPSDSLEAADRALLADPNDWAALALRGRLRLDLNQTDLAIEDLERAVRAPAPAFSDAERADVWQSLGLAYHRHGDLASAQLAQSKAVSLAPGHLAATRELLFIQHKLGRYKEAIAGYQRYLVDYPTDSGFLINYAILLMQEGLIVDSWNAQIAYLNAGGADPRVAVNAAYLADNFGRPDLGEIIVKHMLTYAPDDPTILIANATIAGLLGDHAAALKYARAAAVVDPTVRLPSLWCNIPSSA